MDFGIDLLITVGWGFSCQHRQYIFGVMLSPVGIVRNDIPGRPMFEGPLCAAFFVRQGSNEFLFDR
jgi:hypothetical protein